MFGGPAKLQAPRRLWKQGTPRRAEARAMNKGGRPPGDPAFRRHQRKVYLTVGELEQLQDAAAQVGLSVSDYIRRRALGHPLPPIVPLINRTAFAELARIGANLNQLAHHLNGGNFSPPGPMPDLVGLSGLLLAVRRGLIGRVPHDP